MWVHQFNTIISFLKFRELTSLLHYNKKGTACRNQIQKIRTLKESSSNLLCWQCFLEVHEKTITEWFNRASVNISQHFRDPFFFPCFESQTWTQWSLTETWSLYNKGWSNSIKAVSKTLRQLTTCFFKMSYRRLLDFEITQVLVLGNNSLNSYTFLIICSIKANEQFSV